MIKQALAIILGILLVTDSVWKVRSFSQRNKENPCVVEQIVLIEDDENGQLTWSVMIQLLDSEPYPSRENALVQCAILYINSSIGA